MNISKHEIENKDVFSHLRKMLREDILVMNRMIQRRSRNDKMYDLLASLIQAKRKIILMLPPYKNTALTFVKYQSEEPANILMNKINSSERDLKYMQDILLEMEKSQMNLVKEVLDLEEISPRRREILSNVYSVYSLILYQLELSGLSGRLTPIGI